jgi:phage-related protein
MQPEMKKQPKQLRWLGNSLDAVKGFSDEARRSAGHQLGLVQAGLDPLDWKPIEIVGSGTKEIRVRVETGYRVFYVAKFNEAVYVLHAFVKKTQKTNKKDIDLAAGRYKALMKERNKK